MKLMINLKLQYIFKACWMSKGGGGLPNSDNDRQEGKGDKKI